MKKTFLKQNPRSKRSLSANHDENLTTKETNVAMGKMGKAAPHNRNPLGPLQQNSIQQGPLNQPRKKTTNIAAPISSTNISYGRTVGQQRAVNNPRGMIPGSSSHAAPFSALKEQFQGMIPQEPMFIDEPQSTRCLPLAPGVNIDIPDQDDPLFVTEYIDEIMEYIREKEVSDQVDSGYISRQNEINAKMRSILIDWLVEVHMKFKLLSETLFLTVNIIDKYLSENNVPRHNLQLLGITAMLIASKFEEIYAVEIGDFIYISDHAYTRNQILRFEKEVLNALNFNLSSPSPLYFLRRFSKAARSDSRTHTLSKYLTELALLDYSFLSYLPSEIAAGSVYLARQMTGREPLWNDTCAFYTRYTEEEAASVANSLNELNKRQKEGTLIAIKRKYSLSHFGHVAKLAPV